MGHPRGWSVNILPSPPISNPHHSLHAWIEDLIPALRDIPSTCVPVRRLRHRHNGDPSRGGRSQAEPTTPDIEKHLQADSESLSIKNADAGRTGRESCFVAVCGGPGMNSAVKEASSPVQLLDILEGAPSVSFHVETFGDAARSAFP